MRQYSQSLDKLLNTISLTSSNSWALPQTRVSALCPDWSSIRWLSRTSDVADRHYESLLRDGLHSRDTKLPMPSRIVASPNLSRSLRYRISSGMPKLISNTMARFLYEPAKTPSTYASSSCFYAGDFQVFLANMSQNLQVPSRTWL